MFLQHQYNNNYKEMCSYYSDLHSPDAIHVTMTVLLQKQLATIAS